MNDQLLKSQNNPEKHPLYEIAVIICRRCKERYQPTLVISHGQAIEHLLCPRCHSRITVKTSDHVALVPRDQGNVIGEYTYPVSLNQQTQQLPTLR